MTRELGQGACGGTRRWLLDALDRAWAAGRRRAWVELPPGAGKTLVGLETARRLLAGDGGRPRVDKVVVLGPNTAIQGQWVDQGRGLALDPGTDRSLDSTVTALTYQSVAVFDPEAEAPDAPEAARRTRRSRRDSTRTARRWSPGCGTAGPLLLVLDECHHLLEVWGRLLGELLEQLPHAVVLGLTATPPETLTADQALLVAELFGDVVFEASIPAVVREGDLAPFAELAWLTVPTAVESDWLASEASRFSELVEQLTDPDFGSTPFLGWLDARFLAPEAPWSELVRREPELCAAALRMHHAGLLGPARGRRTRRGAPPRPLGRRLGAARGRLADQGPGAHGRPGRRRGRRGRTTRAPGGGLPLDQARHPARPLARRPRARPIDRQDDRHGGHRVHRAPQPRRADADAGALRPRAGQRDAAGRPARRDRPGGRLGPRRPRGVAARRRHGCAATPAGHRADRGRGARHPGGPARGRHGASRRPRGRAARPAGRGHRRPGRSVVEPRLGAGRDAVLRGRPQPGAGRHAGPARARAGTPVGSPVWSTSPP